MELERKMQGTKGRAHRMALAVSMVLCALALCCEAAAAIAPEVVGPQASEVTATTAVLRGSVNPKGLKTTWRFSFGSSDCSVKPNSCEFTKKATIEAGGSPVAVEASLVGLLPGTVHHFLLEAENSSGKTPSTDRAFATRGTASEGLPDGRAYEQASPVDKDGGDAVGKLGLVKAAVDGNGMSFGSSFGIPGGSGAQSLPSYLALRGPGTVGWATQGLLPPPVFGERAQVQGWLPDFSKTYSNATILGSPRKKALVERSTMGGPSTIVSPYTVQAEYSYVGASPDASIVFFEAEAKLKTKEAGGTLIEGAIEGAHNLYAWDRATGEVSLAGALNDGGAPPKGAIAGPYDWSRGTNVVTRREGGAARGYYLQGTHAITASGDVYFTEAGSGQLFLRVNPTRPQSAMSGETCLKPADACTIHVSASKRSAPDPAGPQPAAFQSASADGSKVFFTSPEKLTDASNTGPEQPEAAIGAALSSTGVIEDEDLIKEHAVGVAVQGSHVYWADPAKGTIGRADLNGGNEEDFIAVPPGECEVEVKPGLVEKVEIPGVPRYVAVDPASKYIYWTNTGLRDQNGEPVDGSGMIGRAEIGAGGGVVSIEPAFICGEVEPSPGNREVAVSNPQGIAVNASHVYWANAAQDPLKHAIARAAIDGGEVEGEFFPIAPIARIPYGVALSATNVYFAINELSFDFGSIRRIPLDGSGEEGFLNFKKSGMRGVALDATHVYWATQGEGSIGRIPIEDFAQGSCGVIVTCEREFVKPVGALNGLAADASRLFWSVNGEVPINPGNDLYRYEPSAGAGMLEDLTPLLGGNGAEVQGVLGASEDGSYVYFAANGDLDEGGEATQGDCQTTQPHGSLPSTRGSCSIYLWHQGTVSFVGLVRGTDGQDWTGTPRELFSGLAPRAAFVGGDGQTLLFRSQEKLTAYENEGVPELYRFHIGDATLRCVSCPPSGEAVGKGPTLGTDSYPGPISPPLGSVAMVESRNLSADGNRAFFETAEALVPADTNAEVSCLNSACLDVYEWEAPETGSCEGGGPAYSPLNEGCVYLISTGKDRFPSFFADASASGDDVFFFTREGLVGQDKDELQDVYDARVGGGLPSQNPAPELPCESVEACHGPYPEPPAEVSPGSATFIGPGDPPLKHKKPRVKKHKARNHKARNHKARNHKARNHKARNHKARKHNQRRPA
jgi:hypothetical protein